MSRAVFNFIIDLFGFLVILGMVSTGLLVRYVLPPGSGQARVVWGFTRHEWGDIHFWLAVGLGAVLLFHLAMHWGWVCSVIARWTGSAAVPRSAHSRLKRNAIGVGALALTALLVAVFLAGARSAVTDREEGRGRHFRGGRAQSSMLLRDGPQQAESAAQPL